MRRTTYLSLGLALALLLQFPAVSAGIECDRIYVDAGAAGGGDGTSWANAFTDLASAIDAAVAGGGGEVWVAAGVYRPTATLDRTASFELADGVRLYGGFAGSEAELGQRDPVAHATVLSGDLAGDDGPALFEDDAENSYRVVVGSGSGASAVLDGFTVTGGNANGTVERDGGGLFIAGGSPTVRNCVFRGNRARDFGGAIAVISNGAPKVSGCEIVDNQSGVAGGGVYVQGAARFDNCLLARNQSCLGGGAFVNASAPALNHCTVAANTADCGGFFAGFGGGIYMLNASPALNNGIVAENTPSDTAVDASLPVYRHTTIGGDPQFVDPAGGDFRLRPTSPAVDAGDNAAVPADVLADLAGQPRFDDVLSAPDTGSGTSPLVDRGAYELAFRRNRHLSFKPGHAGEPVALRVTLRATALGGGFGGAVGRSWWVQAHRPADPPAVYRLGCFPVYLDWGTAPAVIHVGDDEIVPSSLYQVEAVIAGLCGDPSPLAISTVAVWGDVAGPKLGGAWTLPDGLVDASDSSAVVERIQGLAGAPPLASCDVDPAVPNAIVNVADVQRVVLAPSQPYPFPVPAACLRISERIPDLP